MPTTWSSRAVRTALRVLFTAAVCLDLGIAVLALHPNVSPAYAAFFISRTSDCLLRPVDGRTKSGSTVRLVDGSPDAVHVIACGMESPEKTGTWTVGHHAALLLPMAAAGGQELVLQLADAFLPRPDSVQRLVVSANGVSLGEADVTRTSARELTLPLRAVEPNPRGKVMIDIALPDAREPRNWLPNNDDTRELGVMLQAAGIRPSS
jgi:hypothetical protein